MNEKPTIEVGKVPVITKFIYTLGVLPTSYLMSMTYQEQVTWLCNYIQQTLIPQINEDVEAIQELQNLYELLRTYVNDYFDNLDVQEEINNKLDELAQDGTLTTLIKNYVDPYISSQNQEISNFKSFQNQEISNFKSLVNNEISHINNKVDGVVSGNPIPVSSLDDMTDTTKIYVLISTGDWYYYDGDSWEIAGKYQSPVADYDTTLTVKNGIADSKSIGDRINESYYKNNYLDTSDYEDNKKYESDGSIISESSYVIFKSIIPLKNNDTIHLGAVTNGTINNQLLGLIVEVDAYGNFIQLLTNTTSNLKYTADHDCFIKINWIKDPNISFNDLFVYINTIDINYTSNNFINKNKELINDINNTVDDNTIQYNYLDKNKCILNQNLDGNANVVYSSNGFFITNLIPIKNGDVVRFYNFNQSVTFNMIQICKFDSNKHFTERVSVSNNTFTANFDGYFQANCTKPTSSVSIDNLDISINNVLSKHYEYGKVFKQNNKKPVLIEKIANTNFKITFGDYNLSLIKFVDSGANANAWNILTVKKGENVIVPNGTDIIGPVKINQNTDFIGGVHGDETTQHIVLSLNGTSYKDNELESISSIETDKLIILLNSYIYDQLAGDLAFIRNVMIEITNNKIHISNTYKASKDLTLKTACIGGLIACQNPIIKEIILNNSYFNEPPTVSPNNNSKLNTYGVINTIYGTVTINNIKGYENPNYIGYLVTYSNESPIRNKIYFNPYHNGNYLISTNDELSGEFEYLFS